LVALGRAQGSRGANVSELADLKIARQNPAVRPRFPTEKRYVRNLGYEIFAA